MEEWELTFLEALQKWIRIRAFRPVPAYQLTKQTQEIYGIHFFFFYPFGVIPTLLLFDEHLKVRIVQATVPTVFTF